MIKEVKKLKGLDVEWTNINDIKEGDVVKASLPGESPFFKVTKVSSEGFTGKVINTLVGILHPYNKGDEVQFRWNDKFECFLSVYEIEKAAEKESRNA